MKAFLLLLLFPVVAFSQQIPKETIESLAGENLTTASSLHIAGHLTMVGGATMIGIGSYFISKNNQTEQNKGVVGFGCAVFTVGFCINFTSFGYIRKAGKNLKQH
jgi:hypothetical protein